MRGRALGLVGLVGLVGLLLTPLASAQPVMVAAGDTQAELVAVSLTGSAKSSYLCVAMCLGGTAVSGSGASTGQHAVSLTGKSDGWLAVSGTGDAHGWYAVSGTGTATDDECKTLVASWGWCTSYLAVSGAGPSEGLVAASGTGRARGVAGAASLTGPAGGDGYYASGCNLKGEVCLDPV